MTQPTQPETSTPAGRVEITGDRAALHFERVYPQTPEQVWDALTDPAQLAKWYMTDATIDGRVGGSAEAPSKPCAEAAGGGGKVTSPGLMASRISSPIPPSEPTSCVASTGKRMVLAFGLVANLAIALVYS